MIMLPTLLMEYMLANIQSDFTINMKMCFMFLFPKNKEYETEICVPGHNGP